MGNIINKLFIFVGTSGILLYEYAPHQAIFVMAAVVAISGLLEYFNNNKLSLATFIGYLVLSALYLPFIFFLPLVSYDIIRTKYQVITLTALVPVVLQLNEFSSRNIMVIIVIYVLVYLLKLRAINENKLRKEYIDQRDHLTGLSITLEKKINELVINQDIEVNLATLNERNRIAREIHDNVGHLLTSSILQIGAIIAVCKEDKTVKSLELVKDTLNEGMNSIRKSVHNLHDDSINLYVEINKIIKNFTFCKATLNYDITGDMPAKAKYAIIAIIKEALSNVIKHSDGDYVTVSLYEHPSLFQLIIFDNGKKKTDAENFKGMGLESIKQRVSSLNGHIHFDQSKGFKIFISFMKP